MYPLVEEAHHDTAWQGHVPKHACFGITISPPNKMVRLFTGFPSEPSHVALAREEVSL
jgi:hypothetical protein